jgi:hypothetical protein
MKGYTPTTWSQLQDLKGRQVPERGAICIAIIHQNKVSHCATKLLSPLLLVQQSHKRSAALTRFLLWTQDYSTTISG